MAKENKKTKAAETIGNINSLISLLSTHTKDRKWLIHKITKEGPPHKQWQHTLVLNQLQKLIHLKTKGLEKTLAPTSTKNIVVEHHDETVEVPIGFPESLKSVGHPKLAHQLSKGPEHEVVYTAIILQAIEWLIAMETNQPPAADTKAKPKPQK